jgi:hypothetical protein
MKRKLKRKDIDLVVVFFGPEDQGVVSLRRRAWLFYNWGRYHGHHTNLDTGAIVEVGVEDADFELLGQGRSETCNWDDVVPLLTHPRFPLMERIQGK